VALHHAAGVQFQGDFVVIGGFRGEAGALFGSASPDVWRLRGDRWERMPPLTRARGAAAAGVAAGRIVVAGGQAGGALVAETEVFDGDRWRVRAPIPTLRDHVAGASDGTFLYVAGGRRLSIDSVLGAFERYDPLRDRWEALPDLPTPRGGFGAAFTGSAIVTAGGEGPAGTYAQVESFGLGSGRWRSLPDLPVSRHASGVGVIGDRLFVAVGGPRAGGSYSARLDALTVA
jgi:non-specific serine/threonine protein kinase